MVITDLTYDERRRFRKVPVCPICKTMIEDFDSFEKLLVNYRRYKIFTFIHTNCILSFHNTVFHNNYRKEVNDNGQEDSRIEDAVSTDFNKSTEEV